MLETLLENARAGNIAPSARWTAVLGDDVPWLRKGDVLESAAAALHEVGRLVNGEASHLTPEARERLVLVALLHDIGGDAVSAKLAVRLGARAAAEVGCNYLVYRLPEVVPGYPLIRDVLSLVRYQVAPLELVAEDAPEPAFRRLARQVDVERLYWLCRALPDRAGPGDGLPRPEALELFRLFCEEYGLWGGRDPYAGWGEVIDTELAAYLARTRAFVLARAIEDYEEGRIFTPYEAVAISHRYRDGYGELILPIAPAGAGRTAWVERNLRGADRVAVEESHAGSARRVDYSRNSAAVQRAQEALRDALRQGRSVVWDAPNIRRLHRDRLLSIAREAGAKTTTVVFHLPASLLVERNAARVEPVPEDIHRAQIEGIEWPELTEAHETRFVDG